MGRIAYAKEVREKKGIFIDVVCYPLYTILKAANLTTLDYLALDLEGLEFKVILSFIMIH